jgi:hypothetical protein
MKVRVYTNTNDAVNEDWNSYGDLRINTSTPQSCHNAIITGKPNGHHLNKGLDFYQEFYKKIAIDIVTETVFNYPYPQITEKTIRPLVNKRMFIIVGASRTLEFLHSRGFKTFSPFINEDYDTIEDPIERMHFLCSEITRIANMPIDKIRNLVLEYTPVLEHNFNVLKNIESQELISAADKLSKL